MQNELPTPETVLPPYPLPGERAFRVVVVPGQTTGPLRGTMDDGVGLPCFLGLSPDSKFVNRGRLQAILEWLRPRSSQLTVVEGSFLKRWNLQALDGMRGQDAERIATANHAHFATRCARAVQDIEQPHGTWTVNVLDWPAVVRSAAFETIRRAIEAYAETTPAFERGIVFELEQFLGRLQERGNATRPNEAQMLLLRSYVIEEIAMFVHLHRIGLNVEVYAGDDLELMRQLTAGTFSAFPFDLTGRTHISIDVSPA